MKRKYFVLYGQSLSHLNDVNTFKLLRDANKFSKTLNVDVLKITSLDFPTAFSIGTNPRTISLYFNHGVNKL